MSIRAERDPLLEHAREEAEGTEVLESLDRNGFLEKQREEAQGVEVFEDPDATVPASALREGSPGQEFLVADAIAADREDDDFRDVAERDR